MPNFLRFFQMLCYVDYNISTFDRDMFIHKLVITKVYVNYKSRDVVEVKVTKEEGRL